jgi:hypothetical protein
LGSCHRRIESSRPPWAVQQDLVERRKEREKERKFNLKNI